MTGRELRILREHRDRARKIGASLDNTQAFQHERIFLPIHEAKLHAAQLEAFLSDAVETAEAEIYRASGHHKPKE